MVARVGGGSSGMKKANIGSIFRTLENWHGLPKGFEGNFDAVLNGDGPFAGKCYIFKGASYVKYDWNTNKVDPGYPRPIAGNWPGLPADFCHDLDAAINGKGAFAGNCYFFKGDSYVKFDWMKDKAYSDCPKKVAGNWPGLPSGFEGDFDSAMNGNGPFAGKCYFFKDDSYIRFDWEKDCADPGYPKKITEGWFQLPMQFKQGFDATIEGYGPNQGKAYLFKGNDYIRYDWGQDRADE